LSRISERRRRRVEVDAEGGGVLDGRRRRPAKLHADKGYDYDHLRRWLCQRGIRHRIARKGIESSQRLGRHRWVVERTVSWLAGCRRLHRRYERKAEHFLAFVGIAAALIGYRRLIR
jgi:transposase